MSRALSSGSYSAVCTTDAFPLIYATGYVTIPSLSTTLSRTIRLTTTNAALFSTALAAKQNIDLKGNGVGTDSFNSALPNLSNNGVYDPTKTSTNGDVASIGGVVNVANADVHGKVLLGPTATDSIGSNGEVTGGTHNDFNVDFWDVVVPAIGWLQATPLSKPQSIDGVSYDYVFDSPGSRYNYSINGLNGSIYVGTNTMVNLLATGTANLPTIRVAGASGEAGNITIYMDGGNFSLGAVITGNATNLTYLGTPNNTQVNFSGNSTFTGAMYAPQALISLSGGGNNSVDFIGSIVGNSVQVNGHFFFHYDENLLKGLMRGFSATSWRELPPQ
jgi:hypothetical protein